MSVRTLVLAGLCAGLLALMTVNFFDTVHELRTEPVTVPEPELPPSLLREVMDITRCDLS